MGSLFDGIGAFPLAGRNHGIRAVWASEIEPIPIKITKKHFPKMVHLGDVAELQGCNIPPVDVITFGSPCQGLSVAGNREGLSDQRSGLFMEAIRTIREMREATNGEYPRFAIWENVPGAFSTNKRQDFRAVLEEIMETSIPMPYSGKWAKAGMVRGNGRDVAWRCLDAQYWGVPQRRTRIFLVVDFRGECATEVLFEYQGVSGDTEPCEEERQDLAPCSGAGTEGASRAYNITFCDAGGVRKDRPEGGLYVNETDKASTIASKGAGYETAIVEPICFEPRSQDGVPRIHGDVSPTLNTMQGGQRQPCVVLNDQGGQSINIDENVSPTLRAEAHGNLPCILDKPYCIQGSMIGRADKNGPQGDGVNEDVSFTLNTTDRHAVCIPFACNQRDEVRELGDKSGAIQAQPGMKQQTFVAHREVAGTLRANAGAPKHEADWEQLVCQVPDKACCVTTGTSQRYDAESDTFIPVQTTGGYRVRRFTPLECERLMGFPDNFTAGHSDTARYKALGNSIAVVCVDFIMGNIARILEEEM